MNLILPIGPHHLKCKCNYKMSHPPLLDTHIGQQRADILELYTPRIAHITDTPPPRFPS